MATSSWCSDIMVEAIKGEEDQKQGNTPLLLDRWMASGYKRKI
jgi:hypothetical protein